MAKSQRKQKKPVEKPAQLFQPKDFLDLIAPAAVKFNTDSYVLGGLYRCVLALRGYPAATEELALLSHICNRAGVTLHLYARQVTAAEEVKPAEEPKTEEPAAVQEEKPAEPKAKATRTRAARKEDTKAAAKATAKKEEKTAEPKTRSRASAKAATEKDVLQIGGREDVIMNNLIDRVKAAYVAEGHKADTIKNIEVYIKVDENMAYYVIDGYASGISLY